MTTVSRTGTLRRRAQSRASSGRRSAHPADSQPAPSHSTVATGVAGVAWGGSRAPSPPAPLRPAAACGGTGRSQWGRRGERKDRLTEVDGVLPFRTTPSCQQGQRSGSQGPDARAAAPPRVQRAERAERACAHARSTRTAVTPTLRTHGARSRRGTLRQTRTFKTSVLWLNFHKRM